KLGMASRVRARQLIAEGRVRVDGRVTRDPALAVVPEADALSIDGVRARRAGWRTIALHKPRGVVTTRRDPEGRRTVLDLVGDAAGSLVAVGRLDRASTGLLLLTTDTQLANALTDPANLVVRRYVVTVRGEWRDESTVHMCAGIGGLRARNVVLK